MNEVILLILLGLGSGALIAGIAVGVVVTYRGSGIINLALGGYAMLAGYAFWALNTGELGFTLSKAPALILALLFVLGVAAAVELGIFRPLRNTAAAGQARRLARRPADAAGVDADLVHDAAAHRAAGPAHDRRPASSAA